MTAETTEKTPGQAAAVAFDAAVMITPDPACWDRMGEEHRAAWEAAAQAAIEAARPRVQLPDEVDVAELRYIAARIEALGAKETPDDH